MLIAVFVALVVDVTATLGIVWYLLLRDASGASAQELFQMGWRAGYQAGARTHGGAMSGGLSEDAPKKP